MDRTNYQYDLEYRADVRTRIRAVATQLLSGEIGMIAAARELKQFRDGVEPPAARPCPLCDFESTTIKPARYRIGPNQENPQNACLAARPVRCGARYLLTELTQQAERGRGAQ